MPSKSWNYKSYLIKVYPIILVISLFLIPIILRNEDFNYSLSEYELSPLLSGISKKDYNPILSEEKYSLGNITINDMDFSKLEMGFFLDNDTYPLLKEDYDSGAFSITQKDFKFIETIEPAIQDNLNENIEDRNKITVKLNETLEVDYNNPKAGFLIYFSRLSPSTLQKFYVNNGTDTIELNETDFTFDSNDFIVFNYEIYFKKGPVFNFEINFIWEYDLNIQTWSINQYPDQDLFINSTEKNFSVKFKYGFKLLGKKYGETILQSNVDIDNVDVALTMNLPDKDELDGHSLMLNDMSVEIGSHLNIDKSVDILLSDHFLPNSSVVLLNFTSQFTIKFIYSVEKMWAIDRLVSMRDIRERIYMPSLIDGPRHLYVKDLSIYETTIFIDQELSSSSQFERNIELFPLNSSITGKEGIEIKLPYLIPGETCPLIIKYKSDQTLRVIITDNIKMPLVGAILEVFYYGVEFGTYMSNDSVQPISPGMTNEYGEIILNNVPYGNYTVRIYYNKIFLKEATVNTVNNINYIYTNYPHFPLWIVIFSAINGIIISFGVIQYLKNKKNR